MIIHGYSSRLLFESGISRYIHVREKCYKFVFLCAFGAKSTGVSRSGSSGSRIIVKLDGWVLKSTGALHSHWQRG
ncbi:hypothetical protein DPMN_099674 [Dreissena polymorpha]|uniref:Uncharacterized protein n=1 Tax=Dreissena polymorpha TaxID=45954 RepID=A0A9D4LFD0_DREPO|nr:hypothetical protein DPMN_099674 [Dreissena polymorpha]